MSISGQDPNIEKCDGDEQKSKEEHQPECNQRQIVPINVAIQELL